MKTSVLSLPAEGLNCSDVLMNFHNLKVFLNLLRYGHDTLSNQKCESQPRIVGIVNTTE